MSKTRRNFTQFLLLAVSAFGLLSALLLLTDPPPAETAGLTGLLAINSDGVIPMRTLASIDPAQTTAKTVEAALIEIKCNEAAQHLESAGPRLRLKGSVCVPQNTGVTSTKVVNKTNGYVATVFHQGIQFTTDYINLSDGHNDINIQFETENGTVEKNITIVRNAGYSPRK